MTYRRRHQNSRAFALPTVLIASVVMLGVLLSGLVAASSVNVALRQQYVNKVLANAVESGRTMAQECLEQSLGTVSWAGSSLAPNRNCNGTTNANSPYLVDLRNGSNQTVMRSTFTVSGTVSADANAVQTVSVTARIDNIRGTSGTLADSQSRESSVRVRLTQWKDLVFNSDSSTACALAFDQQVYCWGNNGNGALGDGTNTSRTDARPVSGSLRFKTLVSGGFDAFCGIATTDYAYCWGHNREGFLGVGDGANKNVPTLVQGGANPTGRWQKLLLFNYSSCGLSTTPGGYIYCWGANYNYNYGNSGIPLGNISYYPVQATGSNYIDLAGGSHHVCGNAVNLLWCWGLRVNSDAYWYCRVPGEPDPVVVDCPGVGNRGHNPDTTNTTISTSGVAEIISGSDEMCVRATAGTTYCFGANFKGQSGDGGYGPDDGWGTNANRAVPYTCVRNLAGSCMSFKSVRAGAFGFCGIDQSDEAWCWGMGQFGMHGDGSPGFTTSPTGGHVNDAGSHTVLGSPSVISTTFAVKVSGSMKFRKLYSLGFGYCAMNFTNELYCWGRAKNSIFGIQDGVARYYNYPTLAPNAIREPPKAIIY